MYKPLSVKLLAITLLAVFALSSCRKDSDDTTNYRSVKIGKHEWMVDNLNVLTYRNGDPIDYIPGRPEWVDAKRGGYCFYNADSSLMKTYGLIYNWHAVNDSRKLAPEGWHVATNAEWQALINELGGLQEAGGKLKEAGLDHWLPPNTDATNITGFSAYPGGFRSETDGSYSSMGGYGAWWLHSASAEDYAYSMGLNNITGIAYTSENLKVFGAYVRCVKD